jgi:hypothetical protein
LALRDQSLLLSILDVDAWFGRVFYRVMKYSHYVVQSTVENFQVTPGPSDLGYSFLTCYFLNGEMCDISFSSRTPTLFVGFKRWKVSGFHGILMNQKTRCITVRSPSCPSALLTASWSGRLCRHLLRCGSMKLHHLCRLRNRRELHQAPLFLLILPIPITRGTRVRRTINLSALSPLFSTATHR